MTQNRYYSSIYPSTTLSSAIASSGATSMSIASTSVEPSSFPYTMLIDWGIPTQEAVSVTAVSGSGPYTATIVRGIDGTTAQTHLSGAIVVHGVTAQDYNEPQVHIATGTSGSSYPNVIHGLQNGSAVVGTTDTQTLTNKTLAGATFTGGVSITESSAGGALQTISNTHSAPSAANVQWTAETSTDLQLGIDAAGDTDNRFQMTAAGKMQWGAGGASAVDTDLYRSSAGVLATDTGFAAQTLALTDATASGAVLTVTNTISAPTSPNTLYYSNASTDAALGVRVTADTKSRLDVTAAGNLKWGPGGSTVSDTNLYRNAVGEVKTDNSLTTAGNLTVGGAQLLAGGTGVVGVNNASVTPTSTPSGGFVGYAKSGFSKFRGADGLDYNTGSARAYLSSPFTTASSSAAQNVTGMALTLGSTTTYEIDLWLPYVGSGTIGSTATFAFSYGGTTSMVGLVGQFDGATMPAPTYISTISTGFTSPTLTSTNVLFFLRGLITTTTAGALQLTITNTTAADETSVLAGALLKVSVVA